jgi:hypothetical protein
MKTTLFRIIGLLAICGTCWFGNQSTCQADATCTEWPPENTPNSLPEIDAAIGYAFCFNPEKVEALTESIIHSNIDTKAMARAWWVRAYAWGQWSVEYRDAGASLTKYEEARKKTEELDPGLLGERLAIMDVMLVNWVKQPNNRSEALTQILNETANVKDDPIALMRRGKAFRCMAENVEKDPARRKQLRMDGRAAYQRAAELVPTSYEILVESITTTIGMSKTDWDATTTETYNQCASMVTRFIERNGCKRSYYQDNMGPELLLVAIRQAQTGEEKCPEMKALQEKYKSGTQPGWLVWTNVSAEIEQRPTSSPDYTKPYEAFLNRIEKGELKRQGYELRSQLNAYYQLANHQFRQGQPKEALLTYRKLATLSPYYAQLDQNMALVYSSMAKQAKDAEERNRLLQLAREALERQMQHNWHGRATQDAKESLDQLGKE